MNYSEISALIVISTQSGLSGIRECSAPFWCNPAGAGMPVGALCYCPGVEEPKCYEQEEDWAVGVKGDVMCKACGITAPTQWWRDQSGGCWEQFHHSVLQAEPGFVTAPAPPRSEQDPAHRWWEGCKPALMCSCVPGIALQLPRACPEQE